MGSIVDPFRGLYLGSYKVIPKRKYGGAYGYGFGMQLSAQPTGPREPAKFALAKVPGPFVSFA